MTNLGDLSGQVYDITTIIQFGWYGESIRVHPDLTTLALIDIQDEFADQPASGVVVKKMFRATIHPDDFDKFWSAAKKAHADTDDLLRVQQTIVEAIGKRPTLPSSDSSGGPKSTITSFVVEPESTVSPLTSMDMRVAEREDLRNRPDMLRIILDNAEQRTSA